MSVLPAPLEPVRPALLTRVTPVTRLTVGTVWLAVSVISLEPIVPLVLIAAAIVVLVCWSGLPLRRVPGRLVPLWTAIVSLTAITILLSGANRDPSLPALAVIGPFRITAVAVSTGLAIGLRVLVIGLTTLLVFAPSDPTRLADSLVQQWRAPDRFAYGTLAALRIAPLMAGDWTTIGAARRLRAVGGGSTAGRVREAGGRLVVMLVAAIRRAERMALAMDARGFDSGVRRSHYRHLRAGWRDGVVLVVGVTVPLIALALTR